MTPSVARPASTVVLLRPSSIRFDVFLVRRHDNVAFMGGAHVFPGGRVDPIDRLDEARSVATGIRHAHERVQGIELNDFAAYYHAAVRELSEEAGVTMTPDALTPFARWVTPEVEIKRFDAVFFVAVVPPDQQAAHCGEETTEGIWLDPADAIARCRAGAIALPPPTWTTLRTLERFSTMDDVIAWARTRRIVPVQPKMMDAEGGTLLVLPGDPQYPAIADFETPVDTRFLFANRRWTPA
jgi:8-oxo-dGTP pyrophosphatase MutT (NUDIX family)